MTVWIKRAQVLLGVITGRTFYAVECGSRLTQAAYAKLPQHTPPADQGLVRQTTSAPTPKAVVIVI
jgi:hypothetical protein